MHKPTLCDSLPTPSRTAAAILSLAQREDVTAEALAQLIQTDPALTGRILRFANAPAQGTRRPIASVIDAMNLLGLPAIRQFALSLSLIDAHREGRCLERRHFLRNPTGHPSHPREQKIGDVFAFGGPRRPASASASSVS
ncbi:HDOD domain-containing protein [Methylococcus sp. ANG]|uniref:HDOD domain-containing protein n=1 Tax=Methylococcus sp. ANG TaxID=3231903 RepID=UPI003458E376